MNLIINVEDDDKLILSDDTAVLAWQGLGMLYKNRVFVSLIKQETLLIPIIENETELSFFNMEDYQVFKTHPDTMKW